MVAGSLGTFDHPLDQLYLERPHLEERSNDPSNPDKGAMWFRYDLNSGTDKLGELRWYNGTIRSIPVYDTGTSQSGVEEVLRMQTRNGLGFIPVASRSDSNYEQLTLQHGGSAYGFHNDQAPGSLSTTNLAHHYDATKISGSDGDSISTWTDQEGSADLTQSTSSDQPTLRNSGIGGKQVLEFDGGDFMDQTFSNISQPYQVFIVFEATSLPVSTGTYFHGGVSNYASIGFDTNGNEWRMYAGSFIKGGTPDKNEHIATTLFNGGSSYYELEDTQIASGSAGSNALDGQTVGARSIGDNFPGYIGEVLTYDTDLSSSTESDVESHLSSKWGITI